MQYNTVQMNVPMGVGYGTALSSSTIVGVGVFCHLLTEYASMNEVKLFILNNTILCK